MVGEYGVAGLNEDWMRKHIDELRKVYNFSGDKPDSSLLHRDVIKACLEQWKEMGIQGVFYWAWWEGIPGRAEGKSDLTLSSGFEALKEFADSFKNPKLTSADAKIAVICDISKRSQYGSPQDLLLVTDILTRENAVPFHTLFSQAIKEKEEFLSKRKYEKVILLADGLDEETLKVVEKIFEKEKIISFRQEETNCEDKLKKFLIF
jgi:hypothetical protein